MEEKPEKTVIKTADLFAGIGGMRIGFRGAIQELNDIKEEKQAFDSLVMENVFSIEKDKNAVDLYRNYFKDEGEVYGDIKKKSIRDIPDFDVLMAGFPCQSFSILGKREGILDKRGRGNLFYYIAAILEEKKPKVFLLENVPGLVWHDNGKTFQEIKRILMKTLNYRIYYKIINAADFGLAQNRKRIYIVGFRDHLEFNFPKKYGYERFLKDILILDAEVTDDLYLSQRYLEGLKKHKKAQQKMGTGYGYKEKGPDEKSGALLKNANGLEWNLIRSRPSKNCWTPEDGKNKDKPNNEGLRTLSVKECKLLQGFPLDYKFECSKNIAISLIGNSVATTVIKEVAKEIIIALENRNKKRIGKDTKNLLLFFEFLNDNGHLSRKSVDLEPLSIFFGNNYFENIKIEPLLENLVKYGFLQKYSRKKIYLDTNIPNDRNFEKFRRKIIRNINSRKKHFEHFKSIERFSKGKNTHISNLTNYIQGYQQVPKREYPQRTLVKFLEGKNTEKM